MAKSKKPEIKMGKPRRIYSAEQMAKIMKKKLPEHKSGGKKQDFGLAKRYKF